MLLIVRLHLLLSSSSIRAFRPVARPITKFIRLFATETSPSSLPPLSPASLSPPPKFNPFPFPYHHELTVEIESLSNLGFGVARVKLPETSDSSSSTSDSKRWVIFVPSTIPGEIVTVRIYKSTSSYSDADLISVNTPSPHRVEPRCKLYDNCGGCQYQHVDIATQRDWKKQQVVDVFARHNYFDSTSTSSTSILAATAQQLPILDTVGSDQIYNYRSKITPHYDAPRGDPTKPEFVFPPIGFHRKASRNIVDVDRCEIATDAINHKLTSLRGEIKENWPTKFAILSKKNELKKRKNKKRGLAASLLLRDALQGVVTDPRAVVSEQVGEILFSFKAGNFWQNNPYILSTLVDHVLTQAKDSSCSNNSFLVDTYCGSGLFSLSGSKLFEQVAGIEVSSLAVDAATSNAADNKISNCSFIANKAEKIFDEGSLVNSFPRESTAVVVDPPRAGCSPEFITQLIQFGAKRVVYVSCNPATQARDLKLLKESYTLKSLVPFDLFPQTRHIETVATLDKIG